MAKDALSSIQRFVSESRFKLENWACYWLSRSSPYPIKHHDNQKWNPSWPLVSVVIPCFNHGHYLSEVVNSILGQTWQDLEIIVVNDGSTDRNTSTILEKFSASKTRLINHSTNLGLPAARNTGIKEARGKYICCLDADDKLHPTYLEKALLVMESNLGIDFVYAYTQVFGDEDRVWYAPQFDPAELIHYNSLNPPAVFRREAWQVVGGFREEMRQGYEDWEYWIRLTYHGYRGYRIPEKLIYVRRVGESFIHRAMEIHDQLVADIQRYNPAVYADSDWLEDVAKSYREIYPSNPFLNFDLSLEHLSETSSAWIIPPSARNLKAVIEDSLPCSADHQSETLFVSCQTMTEDLMDRVMERTNYFYCLPYYIPRYTWSGFISRLLTSRGIPPDRVIRIG